MWSKWTKEYLPGLRERHRRCGGEQAPHPTVGDVVIIKDESQKRNKWKLGIVQNLIVGRDGIVKAKLRVERGEYERAAQELYPLELSVDTVQPKPQTKLNPTTPPFRPMRAAAVTACRRSQKIAQEEQEHAVNIEHSYFYCSVVYSKLIRQLPSNNCYC